ncbi:MAG: hypothetical protein EZS28_005379 [Streblomastix strix]|uniref:protein-tyrosine-phosphatase n=1 Tax=Streblomastix strix TaxID=222440 RepID=A0A5J4WX39_9EUKA|nr:MAG: hypothetical protein EZS28_005379 [Streblomastix strix]
MRTEDQLQYHNYLPEKDPIIFYGYCKESEDGQEYDFDYYKPNQKSVKSNIGNSKMEISESSEYEQSTTDSDETNQMKQTDLSYSKLNFFEESSNSRNEKPTKKRKEKNYFGFLSEKRTRLAECSRVTETIFIGTQAAADCAPALHSCGITRILRLRSHSSFRAPNFIKVLTCMQIGDMPTSDLVGCFGPSFGAINEAVQSHQKILVQCHRGCSRSPAIVIAYLVQRHQVTLKAAYEYVKNIRPRVNINATFKRQLLNYEYELYGKRSMQFCVFCGDFDCSCLKFKLMKLRFQHSKPGDFDNPMLEEARKVVEEAREKEEKEEREKAEQEIKDLMSATNNVSELHWQHQLMLSQIELKAEKQRLIEQESEKKKETDLDKQEVGKTEKDGENEKLEEKAKKPEIVEPAKKITRWDLDSGIPHMNPDGSGRRLPSIDQYFYATHSMSEIPAFFHTTSGLAFELTLWSVYSGHSDVLPGLRSEEDIQKEFRWRMETGKWGSKDYENRDGNGEAQDSDVEQEGGKENEFERLQDENQDNYNYKDGDFDDDNSSNEDDAEESEGEEDDGEKLHELELLPQIQQVWLNDTFYKNEKEGGARNDENEKEYEDDDEEFVAEEYQGVE